MTHAMTRALIAEDEPLLAQELAEELARVWPELELAATVHDGHAALQAFETLRPELLFLDVKMPGLDGLEVARLVAGRAHVVFITAFDEFAVQAFDEGAVDYLLKPLDALRLVRAVQRVKDRLRAQAAVREPLGAAAAPTLDLAAVIAQVQRQQAERAAAAGAAGPLRWISVQQGRELRLITVEDICYFRADNKYVSVVTADSESLISTPLKDLLPRLDPERFWQVHRGTVVNLAAIKSVSRSPMGGNLVLNLKARPEKLQVSASYAHLFKHM
jgi:DNA-binding LytR/AlgR family response regulator